MQTHTNKSRKPHKAKKTQANIELNADLRMPASAKIDELCWTLSPQKGVQRKLLERDGGEKVVRATSIVRYAPGSSFYDHTHDGGEEFLVLDGTFSDASGDFPKGWYVRNPPGSSHAPFSKEGCTIFVKLGQFQRFDRRAMRKDTSCANADWHAGENGTKTLSLHESANEHISLVQWPAGLKLDPYKFSGGLEIFVVSGRFVDEFGDHKVGDWLRIPAGFGHKPRAIEDTMLYIKTGHLNIK
jgi:anti-sigma factor ChrR (cupin superfamily)